MSFPSLTALPKLAADDPCLASLQHVAGSTALPFTPCCLRSHPAGVEVLRKLGKQLSPLRSLYTAFRVCYPWTAAQLERFVEVRPA